MEAPRELNGFLKELPCRLLLMEAPSGLIKVAPRGISSKFLGILLVKAPRGASKVSYLGASRKALRSSYPGCYVQLIDSYLLELHSSSFRSFP